MSAAGWAAVIVLAGACVACHGVLTASGQAGDHDGAAADQAADDAPADPSPSGDCCDDGPGDTAEAGRDAASDLASDPPPSDVPDVPPDDLSVEPDSAADLAEDVAPEPMLDVEDTAGGPDVSLPQSCDRSGSQDCSPGPGEERCPDGASVFGGDVNAGIDATIAQHPEWFDTGQGASCCPLILQEHVNDYMQAVTTYLAGVGLCASGPGEELAVKRDNACNEAWDIVANPDAETSFVRRFYVGNCFPAFF